MKKNDCSFCNGCCNTPNRHCDIRLHMSKDTLQELISLLRYSSKFLRAFGEPDEIREYSAVLHWLSHLELVSNDYRTTRCRAPNGRKYVVARIHGYL